MAISLWEQLKDQMPDNFNCREHKPYASGMLITVN